MNKSIGQLIKYIAVGIFLNAIGFGLYLIITSYVNAPKTIMTLLYVSSAFLSFFLNKKLTFKYSGDYFQGLKRYMFLQIFGYSLNFLILYIFVDNLNIQHQKVQAASILIVALSSFLISKMYVFNDGKRNGK